jgi:hypothetical protein
MPSDFKSGLHAPLPQPSSPIGHRHRSAQGHAEQRCLSRSDGPQQVARNTSILVL